MVKGNPKWEQFERAVRSLLDLRGTPGSGNQWHDVSDGVSTPGDPYKLMVDCKFTESKSYSLNGDALQKWWDTATELGYHFALPVRLDGAKGRQREWVTTTLDDYAELVTVVRAATGINRCGAFSGPIRGSKPCVRHPHHEGKHDDGEIEWEPEDWLSGWGQGTVKP